MKKKSGGKLGISRVYENDEDEEMIARNNELPEIDLKIETATQISDKDFAEQVLKLDEVDQVKLFTDSYSSQEKTQRFFNQLKTDDVNTT